MPSTRPRSIPTTVLAISIGASIAGLAPFRAYPSLQVPFGPGVWICAAGMLRVHRTGRLALLLQSPVDYLIHETVAQSGLSRAGADSNAQSTAFAVQGLPAAGVDPGSLHRGGTASPLQYLRSLIAADGHVQYSGSSDQTPVWVTGQALMALAGKPLPLAPPAGVPSPAVIRAPPRPRRPLAGRFSLAADVGL